VTPSTPRPRLTLLADELTDVAGRPLPPDEERRLLEAAALLEALVRDDPALRPEVVARALTVLAREPQPRPLRALVLALRRRQVRQAAAAVGSWWSVAGHPGWPVPVRLQAAAGLALVAAIAAGTLGLGAVAGAGLVERALNVGPPASPVVPTNVPAPTPPRGPVVVLPTPTPSPAQELPEATGEEPSETPALTALPEGTMTPRPATTPPRQAGATPGATAGATPAPATPTATASPSPLSTGTPLPSETPEPSDEHHHED
jgi:hypothetical protein